MGSSSDTVIDLHCVLVEATFRHITDKTLSDTVYCLACTKSYLVSTASSKLLLGIEFKVQVSYLSSGKS